MTDDPRNSSPLPPRSGLPGRPVEVGRWIDARPESSHARAASARGRRRRILSIGCDNRRSIAVNTAWKIRRRKLVPLAETLLPAQAFPDTGIEVRDLLGRLPPAARRLLELAYLDGFTHAEIGAMTGQTPAAVRSAVWRARDALRAIAAEGPGHDQ